MVKGLYTAYSGMINEQHRMDVLTNNLANSATVGFKKEGSTAQGFQELLSYRIKDLTDAVSAAPVGYMVPGVKIGENYTDYTQGSFKITENTYDLALSGKGFFTIEYTNKAGETIQMYTRDGQFTLTKEGFLVNDNGDFVLGRTADGGTERIQLDPTKETSIDAAGVLAQGGETIATLAITDFEDYNYIEHFGENYYHPVEGATMKEAEATVFSGYLEASNVNVVDEMVQLINITRAYESNQKIIQAVDTTLEQSTQLGRL